MNKNKVKIGFIILLPLGILFSFLSSKDPSSVEASYSNGINRYIREGLSSAAGIFPFSVAEILVLASVIFCVYYLIKTIKTLIKEKKRKNVLMCFFMNVFSAIGIIYFIFLITWGLNYYRLPFATIAHYNIKPASTRELGDLCESLIEKANSLRLKISENKNGIMYIKEGKNSVFNRASMGYKISSGLFPELGGIYGKPKGVIFSAAMSYAGISGVYFPYTGEPNVNIDIPDSMLPSTTCHEMAHQRGFAREDEANYISYYVCNKSPFVDFQYSGSLLALIYSMDSLYTYDNKSWKTLVLKYSDGLRRDLQNINDFWDKYEGPVEKISNSINNVYLKANMQKNGVYSYGRMVDLLIADFRSKK